MNNFAANAWWADHERKRYERLADMYERDAERQTDPRRAERLKLDAKFARDRAKRWDMGIRF